MAREMVAQELASRAAQGIPAAPSFGLPQPHAEVRTRAAGQPERNALAAGLREAERRTVLVGLDALALIGAVLAAHFLLGGLTGLSTALVGVLAAGTGIATLYSRDDYALGLQRPDTALMGAALGIGSGMVLSGFLHGWQPILAITPLALAFAVAGLLIVRGITTDLFQRPATRLAHMVGTPEEVELARKEMADHPLAGLAPALSAAEADCLVLGRSAMDVSEVRPLVTAGGETLDLPGLYQRLGRRLPVRILDDRWFLEHYRASRGIAFQAAKRLLDVTAAAIGLAVALPLLPFVAAAIWVEDRGPIFYGQLRVGLNGSHFKIWKLRSMRCNAESGRAVWASQNDSRVTRVGSVLRKSRLDEVPQLFNILLGEMSLVGPRPERPEFVAELEDHVPYYSYRHQVRPGLTGWAQVRYPYGASIEDAEEKLSYDLFYIKNRTVTLDLLIALRTVSVVLGRIGSR